MGKTTDFRSPRLLLKASAAAFALVSVPAFAFMAIPPAAPGQPSGVAPADQATDLCHAIEADLAAQQGAKTVEDLEATIVFRLSQADVDYAVQKAALSCVSGSPAASAALGQALDNVQMAFLRQRLMIGTGAITGGNSGLFGRSSFVAPVVNVGVVSSDYSS